MIEEWHLLRLDSWQFLAHHVCHISGSLPFRPPQWSQQPEPPRKCGHGGRTVHSTVSFLRCHLGSKNGVLSCRGRFVGVAPSHATQGRPPQSVWLWTESHEGGPGSQGLASQAKPVVRVCASATQVIKLDKMGYESKRTGSGVISRTDQFDLARGVPSFAGL